MPRATNPFGRHFEILERPHRRLETFQGDHFRCLIHLRRRRTEVRSDLGCFPLQLRSSRASAGIIATPIAHGDWKKGYQDTTRKMTEGGCTSLILVLISIIKKKMLRSSAVQSLVTGSSTQRHFATPLSLESLVRFL